LAEKDLSPEILNCRVGGESSVGFYFNRLLRNKN
jgi:hypothetical protein